MVLIVTARVIAALHLDLVRQHRVVAAQVTLHLNSVAHGGHAMLHLDVGGRRDLHDTPAHLPGPDEPVRGQGLNHTVELGVAADGSAGCRHAGVVALNLNLTRKDGTIRLLDTLNLDGSTHLCQTLVLIHPGAHGDLNVAATDDPGPHTAGRHGFDHAVELDVHAGYRRRHGRGRTGIARRARIAGRAGNVVVIAAGQAHLHRQERTVLLHVEVRLHPQAHLQCAQHDCVRVAGQLHAGNGEAVRIHCVQGALELRVGLHLIHLHTLGQNAAVPIGNALHLHPAALRGHPHTTTDARQRIHLDRNTGHLPHTLGARGGHAVHNTLQFKRVRIGTDCRREGREQAPHQSHNNCYN